VNLGTGGSDLGPRLLADALADGTLDVRFAANVDPRDLARALEGAEPASTLLVVASKTFTTQETMANAVAARQWGARHFFAITANVDAARAFGAEEILPMWDWVGGRFSVWSAVGFAAACAIGWEAFEDFLSGGHEVDEHFAKSPIEKNVPVLMALAGVWNTNFLGAATHAVLPYSNALRLLPGYLQQLEMESNGKHIDREGRVADYAWRWISSISTSTAGSRPTCVPKPTRSLSARTIRSCRRTSNTRGIAHRVSCPSRA
jgi:glucose-6-phosphate isomerase